MPLTTVADDDRFLAWRASRDDFNALFGTVRYRVEADKVRCRFETGVARANVLDTLHGGFTLAALDQSLFIAAMALGRIELGGAVTIAQSSQFVGAGRIDQPLDAVVECVAETGRMLFLRGLMEQGDHRVMSFEGTLRKLGKPAA